MSKPLLIGVTGGIGSGKSTVCQIFETLGTPIYYTDDRAKALMEEDEMLKSQIKEIFGAEAYQGSSLNRKEISKKAFEDKHLLEKLNQVVHPAVRRDFEKWVDIHSGEKLLVKEAALLIEAESYKELDKLILVTADEETRITRVLQRDTHRTRDDIKKIMSRQLSDQEKKKLADFTIENNEGNSLVQQVSSIYDQLIVA